MSANCSLICAIGCMCACSLVFLIIGIVASGVEAFMRDEIKRYNFEDDFYDFPGECLITDITLDTSGCNGTAQYEFSHAEGAGPVYVAESIGTFLSNYEELDVCNAYSTKFQVGDYVDCYYPKYYPVLEYYECLDNDNDCFTILYDPREVEKILKESLAAAISLSVTMWVLFSLCCVCMCGVGAFSQRMDEQNKKKSHLTTQTVNVQPMHGVAPHAQPMQVHQYPSHSYPVAQPVYGHQQPMQQPVQYQPMQQPAQYQPMQQTVQYQPMQPTPYQGQQMQPMSAIPSQGYPNNQTNNYENPPQQGYGI